MKLPSPLSTARMIVANESGMAIVMALLIGILLAGFMHLYHGEIFQERMRHQNRLNRHIYLDMMEGIRDRSARTETVCNPQQTTLRANDSFP